MKRNAVFRITGDLCFYFAILSIFDSLRVFRLPMAAITVSCFVLGFVIIRCRSRLVRLLLSLLPALCFLLAESSYLMLFPALGLLYYVLVMTAGAFAMPLDEYRRGYRLQLVIALFFIAANIANSTLYRSRFLSPDGLVYVFLFLFLGVLTMRGMQMGASMDLRWRLNNLLSVVGLPLCAVGASLLLFLFLRFSAPVVAYLFYPIGRFLVWLIAKLFPRQELEIVVPPELAIGQRPPSIAYKVEDSEGPQFVSSDSGGPFSGNLLGQMSMIGAYVVFILLLALALWVILFLVRRSRPQFDFDEAYYEDSAAADKERRTRRRGGGRLGRAGQLRRIYQVYLETMAARGVSIDKADTSADVLTNAAGSGESAEAARLRELYIAARYGDPKAVTAEQVAEAQHCLDLILGEK